MVILSNIQSELENPSKFHYKKEWIESTIPEEQTIYELYAFGTIADIPATVRLSLTVQMIKKLQLLTIISLAQQQGEISYNHIMSQCEIDSMDTIERYMIELRQVFQIKLDSVRQIVKVINLYDCRDIYDNERPLMFVAIPKFNKTALVEKLEQWKGKLTQQIQDRH
ncbi:COP9 signalosome complex subunit 9 [Maudiozyma exigua]|uniref:COP9 signalosome complex subunit 9 n=1 Tax=Maudiozyma exigua TaxID=34358 RepID=A0A9P7B8C4_MAUEX|nr:COP9 signalosome complex subunit 9 [Kazachstania exigua]